MAKQKVQHEESSHSRKYRLRVRTAHAEFEGLFYSPHPERRLSEVLTRMEQFLNLRTRATCSRGTPTLRRDQQVRDRVDQGPQGVS